MLCCTAQHLLTLFLEVCDRLLLSRDSASEIVPKVLVSTDLRPRNRSPVLGFPYQHMDTCAFSSFGSHRETF